jgi:hypothetical protein
MVIYGSCRRRLAARARQRAHLLSSKVSTDLIIRHLRSQYATHIYIHDDNAQQEYSPGAAAAGALQLEPDDGPVDLHHAHVASVAHEVRSHLIQDLGVCVL